MSYTPKLSDLDGLENKEGGYEPSLSDLEKNFPDKKDNMSTQRLKYITGIDRTPLDSIRDLTEGVLSGLGKGGQFVASTLTGGRAPKIDFNEVLSNIGSKNKSILGEMIKGAGEYLPYAALGGASFPGQVIAGATSGAALSNPKDKNLFGILPSGSKGAAIEGALINALTHGTFKGLEQLRPSKMFRGNLSPEELQRNLEITQGTETGLGDVIESPFLKKRLENTLTNVPFSGANESLQRTGKQVLSRGENILSDMLGDNDPHSVPQKLTEKLIEEFKKHETNKNILYTDANKISNDIGLKLELPSFSKKATEFSNAIDQMNLLKSDPDISKIYKKLQNYKNPIKNEVITGAILDVNGKPILKKTSTNFPSLEEANILKGKLNNYAEMAAQSPTPADRNTANVYRKLADSLKKDINQSIKKSGNLDLKKAYEIAEENYAKNFSPFLDKNIYKFISGNADPETIVQKFIKTSPTADLAATLEKLSSKVPESEKSLLAYSYFSRALDNEGNLTPSKLGTSIEKLGHNQFKTLVPDPAMRKKLKDYSKLQHMNKEAQYLMYNPKTGQRNTDTLVTALLAMLGKTASGDASAIALPISAIGSGRYLTKKLTSENFRDSLIKEMIKNKTRFYKPENIIGTQLLTRALNGENNGN